MSVWNKVFHTQPNAWHLIDTGIHILNLCDHALRLSTCNSPGDAVPIAARKQAVATWVRVKRLLQQDIGSKMKTRDECEDEEVSAMTRVLVAVEMLRCNRSPRHKEFSVPGLPELVSMASECSWSDAVVELQAWCQLAAVCHHAKDHRSVLRCTGSALQLEAAAAASLGATARVLYGPTAVSEMLSGAGCLRALTLVRESGGDLHAYGEAMELLLAAVRNAEKAESPALCVAAAGRYWSTCLPLTQTPEGRRQLLEPLEEILSALVHTNRKHKQNKGRASLTLTAPPLGSSKHEASEEEDLSLRAAMYSLLLHVHLERTDWAGAQQLLDRAIRDTPRSRHRLPLLKHRILVKAQLGKSVLADMQKFQDEEEQCCSSMWHQVALCAGNITQQLTCYQKSITCLLSEESRWEKLGLLLEFGEWLYGHDFPKAAARRQVQWAVDLLLLVGRERAEGSEVTSQKRSLSSESPVGMRGSSWTSLKEVRRLDGLVRAHTLLAVMADRTSPERRLNLLRASVFVLRIWQVSMAVGWEISNEMAKNQPAPPPTSAGSKKGKDKGKGKKGIDPTPVEERPKPVVLDQELPSSPQDWARYACPQQARLIFRTNSNPHCVNTLSITKQTQSLFYLDLLERELCSLSLDHLTSPIMHLAETIAHDLLDRSGLSDLYRLRIVRRCSQLGLETHSPYQEKLLSLSRIQEQEQMRCHRAIAVSHEGRGLHQGANQKVEGDGVVGFGQQKREVSAQHIWLDKADVCLGLGLHQAARQLLAEAHCVAEELRDLTTMARSLLSLAVLACEEQNFAQALILLDEAHAVGGDEEFWYQLTLTNVRAVVGQRDQDAHTKAEQIIKRGYVALKLVLERRVNRAPEIIFFITSLEMREQSSVWSFSIRMSLSFSSCTIQWVKGMYILVLCALLCSRGAVESIRALGGGEPGKRFSNEAVQRLMAACDTLRECASGFIKLGYKDHAAETHAEYAHGLRTLAGRSAHAEDKRRFLLDGVSQLQLAVTEQEHVALTAQTLLPSQQENSRAIYLQPSVLLSPQRDSSRIRRTSKGAADQRELLQSQLEEAPEPDLQLASEEQVVPTLDPMMQSIQRTPSTLLAFFSSLFSLFLSAAAMLLLLLQKTTP
ncbi:cilia- and flagella-associated protein 46-like isoform X3 [Pseudoliparis swirei]|uniref:cilia- and flagella-associated protein 46-like isoform X3 n=1 Tax=Pseudoliparis swirei TaxID=2059687 RepID=UPI0024BD9113|nr:cilia- and flagella-associated protein 46-like isoform X3 [Pseudoliparis swirei]